MNASSQLKCTFCTQPHIRSPFGCNQHNNQLEVRVPNATNLISCFLPCRHHHHNYSNHITFDRMSSIPSLSSSTSIPTSAGSPPPSHCAHGYANGTHYVLCSMLSRCNILMQTYRINCPPLTSHAYGVKTCVLYYGIINSM